MELVFFQRIGEARTKLKGIEEKDNGQGNGSMVNWGQRFMDNPNADKNAYKWIFQKMGNPQTFGIASVGQIAQLVEQRTENPCVGGSIPPLATA